MKVGSGPAAVIGDEICNMPLSGGKAGWEGAESRGIRESEDLPHIHCRAATRSWTDTDKNQRIKQAYPGIPVRWAYTSSIIRAKLAKQGKILDSPEVALAKMQDEDFTHVAVQSLHTIGGSEYHDLHRSVGAFKSMGAFERVILGYPLLATQKDMERTVEALLGVIPKQRKKKDAVVFMGHGSHHPSNAFYAALMFQVQVKDPNVFIGNVEGYPEIDDIKSWLLKKKIKKAYLMPFMSVAGDHAKNDMAGDEPDSWKSILTAAGIKCETVLKGSAEFDSFVDIWVDHLGGPLGISSRLLGSPLQRGSGETDPVPIRMCGWGGLPAERQGAPGNGLPLPGDGRC